MHWFSLLLRHHVTAFSSVIPLPQTYPLYTDEETRFREATSKSTQVGQSPKPNTFPQHIPLVDLSKDD